MLPNNFFLFRKIFSKILSNVSSDPGYGGEANLDTTYVFASYTHISVCHSFENEHPPKRTFFFVSWKLVTPHTMIFGPATRTVIFGAAASPRISIWLRTETMVLVFFSGMWWTSWWWTLMCTSAKTKKLKLRVENTVFFSTPANRLKKKSSLPLPSALYWWKKIAPQNNSSSAIKKKRRISESGESFKKLLKFCGVQEIEFKLFG